MTTIYVPGTGPRARFGGVVNVGVNGVLTDVPVGILTDQPVEVVGALDSAGVFYRSTVVPPIPSGMICISGTGSRVAVGVNGVIVYYPVNLPFAADDATRQALIAAGIAFAPTTPANALTFLGTVVTFNGIAVTFGA